MVQLLYLLKWDLSESRRGKCVGQIVKYWYQTMHLDTEYPVKYWYQTMHLDTEYPVKQCYEWQEHNMTVRVWIMELKQELYNIRLALVWRKQQECNLRTITKIVKGKFNDTERQNILARMSEMRPLTHQKMNFSWGKDQVQNLEGRKKWKCSCQQGCGSSQQSDRWKTDKDPLYV